MLRKRRRDSAVVDRDPDVRKLLHELQVLRIELELQNAELAQARDEAGLAVGEGVSEMRRIHNGPGCRAYFTQRGLEVVIVPERHDFAWPWATPDAPPASTTCCRRLAV